MAKLSLLGYEDGVYKIFVIGQSTIVLYKRIDGEWHLHDNFQEKWIKTTNKDNIAFLNKLDRTLKLKKLLDE